MIPFCPLLYFIDSGPKIANPGQRLSFQSSLLVLPVGWSRVVAFKWAEELVAHHSLPIFSFKEKRNQEQTVEVDYFLETWKALLFIL